MDKQVIEYVAHYNREYLSVKSHIGDLGKTKKNRNRKINNNTSFLDDFTKTLNDFTKRIRMLQSYIDQSPKDEYECLMNFILIFYIFIYYSYFQIQSINKQLIEFERLFIRNDGLYGMNSVNKKFR